MGGAEENAPAPAAKAIDLISSSLKSTDPAGRPATAE
jgi:hypothetical protein